MITEQITREGRPVARLKWELQWGAHEPFGFIHSWLVHPCYRSTGALAYQILRRVERAMLRMGLRQMVGMINPRRPAYSMAIRYGFEPYMETGGGRVLLRCLLPSRLVRRDMNRVARRRLRRKSHV